MAWYNPPCVFLFFGIFNIKFLHFDVDFKLKSARDELENNNFTPIFITEFKLNILSGSLTADYSWWDTLQFTDLIYEANWAIQRSFHHHRFNQE